MQRQGYHDDPSTDHDGMGFSLSTKSSIGNSSSGNFSGGGNGEDLVGGFLSRPWGFGRRRPRSCPSPHIGTSTDLGEDRHEFVLYSAPDLEDDCDDDDNNDHCENYGEYDDLKALNYDDDVNSLISSNSNNGQSMHSTNMMQMQTPEPLPVIAPFMNPFRRKNTLNLNSSERSLFGEDRHERDRGGLLALPIVRPFLRGNRRGFRDQAEVSSLHSSNFPGDVDDVDGDDGATPHDESNAPSRFDRAVMKHSISQGITGTNDDVLLPTSYSTSDIHSMNRLDSMGSDRNNGNNNPPPIQWGRLLTQIFKGNGRPRQIKLIEQLHGHIRKEDWSLATELLNVHPELARTWYNIERLYGGKYDGEALPLHAACALHPPPSFVKFLSDCYPEGLLKKDKAFGRVPLHVACRSLADSSVLAVLAELEPRAVEERDNLMRVPLHYLIKNYSTFGDDDEEVDYECPSDDEDAGIERDGEKCDLDNIENPNAPKSASNTDGMDGMKILVKTRPNCVRVSDHRGWIPLHVACSCSSRRGMTRVIKFLLREWPESINCKTDKDSDVFNCVGKSVISHHFQIIHCIGTSRH